MPTPVTATAAASRPTPPRRSRPPLATERPARMTEDVYEARMARLDAELAASRQRSDRRKALTARLDKLHGGSQGAFLFGFATMFAAGAAGPALPFVMGAGMLLMTAVPAALWLVGAGARKELEALDAEVGVY